MEIPAWQIPPDALRQICETNARIASGLKPLNLVCDHQGGQDYHCPDCCPGDC